MTAAADLVTLLGSSFGFQWKSSIHVIIVFNKQSPVSSSKIYRASLSGPSNSTSDLYNFLLQSSQAYSPSKYSSILPLCHDSIQRFPIRNMSFTNAPVTRTLVVGLVSSSVAASLFDVKHYFYIDVGTHFWSYHQPWRALIFQLCYTNSAEVLSAVITLYNMRVVERLWGSRKYAVCSGRLSFYLIITRFC